MFNINVGHATPRCIIPFGIDSSGYGRPSDSFIEVISEMNGVNRLSNSEILLSFYNGDIFKMYLLTNGNRNAYVVNSNKFGYWMRSFTVESEPKTLMEKVNVNKRYDWANHSLLEQKIR